MPGRPKQRAMVVAIEQAGGVETILERISEGENLTSIARTYGVSRWMLNRWLLKEHEEVYQEARRESSHALVDQATTILDAADGQDGNSAKVQAARNRAQQRQWRASLLNRRDYGAEQTGAGAVINIGQLHLTALHRGASPEQQLEAPDPVPLLLVGEEDDA